MMVEKREHFRAPVSNTFRKKSPFRQLLLHMTKVRNCIDTMEEGIVNYFCERNKSIAFSRSPNFPLVW